MIGWIYYMSMTAWVKIFSSTPNRDLRNFRPDEFLFPEKVGDGKLRLENRKRGNGERQDNYRGFSAERLIGCVIPSRKSSWGSTARRWQLVPRKTAWTPWPDGDVWSCQNYPRQSSPPPHVYSPINSDFLFALHSIVDQMKHTMRLICNRVGIPRKILVDLSNLEIDHGITYLGDLILFNSYTFTPNNFYFLNQYHPIKYDWYKFKLDRLVKR